MVQLAAFSMVAAAKTVRYVLTSESRIIRSCDDCTPVTETLQGSFEVTFLPVPTDFAVEALTAVAWWSESYEIRGLGFLQRLGSDRLAMVIDARVNEESVLLTTGRRQRSSPGQIRVVLGTPDGIATAYVVRIVAEPAEADGPDADGDGVHDGNDNCREAENHNQADADGDRVGDMCDVCPETPAGMAVLANGCAATQVCPCYGPADGSEWPDRPAYLRCLTGTLKTLWREGKLSRSEVVHTLREAVRSFCGRRVLAAR